MYTRSSSWWNITKITRSSHVIAREFLWFNYVLKGKEEPWRVINGFKFEFQKYSVSEEHWTRENAKENVQRLLQGYHWENNNFIRKSRITKQKKCLALKRLLMSANGRQQITYLSHRQNNSTIDDNGNSYFSKRTLLRYENIYLCGEEEKSYFSFVFLSVFPTATNLKSGWDGWKIGYNAFRLIWESYILRLHLKRHELPTPLNCDKILYSSLDFCLLWFRFRMGHPLCCANILLWISIWT